MTAQPDSDLICFSHLRWHFVWQRPQHLLTRAARDRHVWYVEEPRETQGTATLEITAFDERVSLVVPLLPAGLTPEQACDAQRALLAGWWSRSRFNAPLLWYYTPMAMAFTRSLPAGVVVYDCMAGLPTTLVEPVPANRRGPGPPRPKYAPLGSERGMLLPSLDRALVQWVREAGGRATDSEGYTRTVAGPEPVAVP